MTICGSTQRNDVIFDHAIIEAGCSDNPERSSDNPERSLDKRGSTVLCTAYMPCTFPLCGVSCGLCKLVASRN